MFISRSSGVPHISDDLPRAWPLRDRAWYHSVYFYVLEISALGSLEVFTELMRIRFPVARQEWHYRERLSLWE